MKYGTEIHGSHMMYPTDFGGTPTFPLRWTFVVLSEMSIGWIAMTLGPHVDVPLRMNYNIFGDPLTFQSSSGQNFNLSNTLVLGPKYLQN